MFLLAPVDGGGVGVLSTGGSGRGQCRVAAFGVCGLLDLAIFFITISHCAWRHVISLSKATKKRSKENAFKTRAHKLTQRAVFTFLAPQKHGARKSHGCVNRSFSEHGHPHASPPVTEPAQGTPRAIRGKPSFEFVRMPNYVGNQPRSELAKMCQAVADKNNVQTNQTPTKKEAVKMHSAVM